jgi:hypothetical protein
MAGQKSNPENQPAENSELASLRQIVFGAANCLTAMSLASQSSGQRGTEEDRAGQGSPLRK